jgi:hypothetical protein
MSRSQPSVVVVLVGLSCSLSCFQPAFSPCHVRCDLGHACPPGYACGGGVCVHPDEQCPIVDPGVAGAAPPDGAATPPDGGLMALDAPDAPAQDAGEPFCFRERCLERGAELVPRFSLWVDPTTLPGDGEEVQQWRDRSAEGNHLTPPSLAPRVRAFPPLGGAGVVAFSALQMALVAPSRPSLDLGSGDVLALAVATQLELGAIRRACLINKSDNARPKVGVELDASLVGLEPSMRPQIQLSGGGESVYVPAMDDGFRDGKLHLFVMRRAGDRLELRIDGAVQGVKEVPAAAVASNEESLFVGGCDAQANSFNGLVAAAAILRGPLAEEEFVAVERFFLRAYLEP